MHTALKAFLKVVHSVFYILIDINQHFSWHQLTTASPSNQLRYSTLLAFYVLSLFSLSWTSSSFFASRFFSLHFWWNGPGQRLSNSFSKRSPPSLTALWQVNNKKWQRTWVHFDSQGEDENEETFLVLVFVQSIIRLRPWAWTEHRSSLLFASFWFVQFLAKLWLMI